MIRIITCLVLFLAAQMQLSAQCQYSLVLSNNFGNGWDIGFVTYTINGVSQNATLVNAIDTTITLNVTNGQNLSISFTEPLFNFGNTIELFDSEGVTVFGASDPAAGVLYTGQVSCPACPKVTGVYLENVLATSVKIRWSPVNAANKYRVIYGTRNFAAGAGDTIITNLPKATITGLTEMSEYDFYVNALCGTTDTSTVVGPVKFKTYWSDDVAVTGISHPTNSCGLGSEPVTFKMTNFGANPQTLVTYNYSVNGTQVAVSQPMDGLFTGVIGKDSTIEIPFEMPYDFSASGEYEICVWVEKMGDDNTLNDTFCTRITNALVLPYAQNFEDWDGGWLASGALSSWEHGKPIGTNINTAASGENAWVTNLNGDYNASETSYLTSPCFDLSSIPTTDSVAFFCNVQLDLESDYDGVWLEQSTDGGSTWVKVGNIGEGLNWYNESFGVTGDQWSGTSNGWTPVRHLLNNVAGKDSVQLRFAFRADLSNQLEGIGVDDIQITVPRPKDLALVGITTLGANEECGLANDRVRVRIANFGTQPQNVYSASYTLNGGAPVTENINQAIAPDQVIEYLFIAPFTSSFSLANITATVNLSGDQVQVNNASSYTVTHQPLAAPLYEDFENGVPARWDFPTGSILTGAHGNATMVMAYNLYSGDDEFIYNTPVIGPINSGDTLTYDYRIVNWLDSLPTAFTGGNSFTVRISSDCGSTYTAADLINGSNHTPSAAMARRKVSLESFVGKNIKVQFIGKWGTGDYWFDLDNIGVRAKDIVSVDPIPGINQLEVYPNPVSGTLQITGQLDQTTQLEFSVYNMLGARVSSAIATHTDQFRQQMDLSTLPTGLYFLRISNGEQQQTIKIVKAAQN